METKQNRAERRRNQKHGLGRIRDVLETRGATKKVNRELLNKYIEAVEAAINSNDPFKRDQEFMRMSNSSPKTFQKARAVVLNRYGNKIKEHR